MRSSFPRLRFGLRLAAKWRCLRKRLSEKGADSLEASRFQCSSVLGGEGQAPFRTGSTSLSAGHSAIHLVGSLSNARVTIGGNRILTNSDGKEE